MYIFLRLKSLWIIIISKIHLLIKDIIFIVINKELKGKTAL